MKDLIIHFSPTCNLPLKTSKQRVKNIPTRNEIVGFLVRNMVQGELRTAAETTGILVKTIWHSSSSDKRNHLTIGFTNRKGEERTYHVLRSGLVEDWTPGAKKTYDMSVQRNRREFENINERDTQRRDGQKLTPLATQRELNKGSRCCLIM